MGREGKRGKDNTMPATACASDISCMSAMHIKIGSVANHPGVGPVPNQVGSSEQLTGGPDISC